MSEVVLIVLRLALSGVFLAAAMPKIVHPKAFGHSLEEFGVNFRGITPALTVAIPLLEVALGIGLLSASLAWWACVGVLLVLTAFTSAIAANLLKGRRPSCNCFGQLRPKPIGKGTLVRNLVLAAAAGYLASKGTNHMGPDVIGFAGSLTAATWLFASTVAIAVAVTSIQGWLIAQLLHQQGRLLVRIDGLEMRLGNLGVVAGTDTHRQVKGLTPGAIAPTFTGVRLSGGATSLEDMRQMGIPIILLFSDPQCAPCNALMPQLAKWHAELAGRASIFLVTRGNPEEVRRKLSDGLEQRPDNVLVQKDREIAMAFRSDATPSAVLINSLGLIDSHLAVGAKEITQLIATVPEGVVQRTPAGRVERKPSRGPAVFQEAKFSA